jgi:hypothetical protein
MGARGWRDAENRTGLIDANWGSSTDVVYQFCRQSPWAGIVYPSHGRYVGASSKPMTDYRKQPGDKLGFNWMMPNVAGKRAIRHVIFDSNFWKSFLQARLAVPLGDRGSLALLLWSPPAPAPAHSRTPDRRIPGEDRWSRPDCG